MIPEADVVIIGAGPAGLAGAIVLGRHGIRVHVVDRQSLPADKVCGEGIMPPGLCFLEEIGAAALLSPADKYPFAGIRYLTAGGRVAEAEFAEGPGRGVRRTALSAALREVAATLPDVTIHENVRVTGLQRHRDIMQVTCHEAPPLRCRLVVAADGLRSRVRRWAGLEGAPARHRRFGVRRHFRLAPWSRFVEVHSGPNLEAYVTPCGPACVGVAILWDNDRAEPAQSGDQLFPALLARLPALDHRLAGAEALSTPRATGPFAQRTTRRTADGLVLLGDASGYLDPCTGEGLTLAFKQALALEACVVPALASSPRRLLPRRALHSYERAWHRIMRPYLWCTRLLLFCHRHPAVFERAIAMLARRPELLRHFLSVNMGTAPLLPGFRRTARRLLPAHPPHAENP